jgi:hypothetical protein
MDFIDHLIYTTNTDKVRGNYPPLLSDYAGKNAGMGIPGRDEIPVVGPVPLPALPNAAATYALGVRENFIFYEDSAVLDKALQKHWYDINDGPINIFNLFDPLTSAPPYHIIYAYLIENSRIAQIFERLIYLYQHDEVLGTASANDPQQRLSFQWIMNTDNLFFKQLPNNSYRNITGNLRPSSEGSRRNAYYRIFGMDLAFGDPSTAGSTDYSYYKSKTANKEFILLFEQFLSEIWQAYINAQNTSGANTTDYQRIVDMAMKIRQMLMARRGGSGTIALQDYRFMNLSKEEYSSVAFMSWLLNIISYNSPVVNFLSCQANTASERLTNIGKRVGIEAHTRAQGLFDMAPPTATVLRQIEFGTFELAAPVLWIRRVIESQTPAGSLVATPPQRDALIDLLTIINNWEKATGHRIKNPEVSLKGAVRVQQNGVPSSNGVASSNGVKQHPMLN